MEENGGKKGENCKTKHLKYMKTKDKRGTTQIRNVNVLRKDGRGKGIRNKDNDRNVEQKDEEKIGRNNDKVRYGCMKVSRNGKLRKNRVGEKEK